MVPCGSSWNRIASPKRCRIFWSVDIAAFSRLELDLVASGLARGTGGERIGDFLALAIAAAVRWRSSRRVLELVDQAKAGMAEFRRFSRSWSTMLEGRCWKAWAKGAELLALRARRACLAGWRARRPSWPPWRSTRRADRGPQCPRARIPLPYYGRAPEWPDLDRPSAGGRGLPSLPPMACRKPEAPNGQARKRVGVRLMAGAMPRKRRRVGGKRHPARGSG